MSSSKFDAERWSSPAIVKLDMQATEASPASVPSTGSLRPSMRHRRPARAVASPITTRRAARSKTQGSNACGPGQLGREAIDHQLTLTRSTSASQAHARSGMRHWAASSGGRSRSAATGTQLTTSVVSSGIGNAGTRPTYQPRTLSPEPHRDKPALQRSLLVRCVVVAVSSRCRGGVVAVCTLV